MAAPQERLTNEPPPSDSELVDRLALTGQALQGLTAAHDLYNTLAPYHYNAYPAVDIAETQAVLGIDSTALTREARQLANTERFGSVNAVGIYRDVARIQARTGKQEAAFTTLAQARQLDHGSVFSSKGYLDIVRVALEQGVDPTEALERAHNALATGHSGFNYRPHFLGELALLHKEAGLDPQPLLDEALQSEEAAEGISGYGYKQVVEHFAACGNFDQALQLVPRIGGLGEKKRNDEARREGMGTIAYYQAYAGQFAEAQQTAEQTTDVYTEAMTACYIAHAAAEEGGDTHIHIERAREQIDKYLASIRGNKDEEAGLMSASFMLARLGEAQTLVGVDAQETFAQAIAALSTVSDTNEKTDALVEVARAQDAVGLDAAQTFNLALTSADKIADAESLSSTSLPPNEYQILAYLDLADVAIDCGHYELVEPIMERMDRYGDNTDKIKLLTMRARHAAGIGLTPDEIRSLTPAQITEIEASNNTLATAALAQFR